MFKFKNEFFVLILYLLTFKSHNIVTQICGIKNPSNINDCLNDTESNSDDTCCFAKVGDFNITANITIKNSTVCILINKNNTFMAPFITQMNLGIDGRYITTYINCGNQTYTNSRAFETCGPSLPQSLSDCSLYSVNNNTCCYMASPDGTSTCLLNKGKINGNKTIYGVSIICQSVWLKINMILYIIIFSIFIL
jgi:hypothetical protein